MEAMEMLKTRRSVRAYKADAVDEELLQQIMEAGLYAPSGMNHQSAIIIAVTNKEVRDTLSKMNCEIGGFKEGFDPFYGAPAVLIVLADKTFPTYQYDGTLVMENLMLAAHALGLGSCWIHRAKEEFMTDYGKKLLSDLGITGDYEGIGHCIVGYAAGDAPKAAPRKENRIYKMK